MSARDRRCCLAIFKAKTGGSWLPLSQDNLFSCDHTEPRGLLWCRREEAKRSWSSPISQTDSQGLAVRWMCRRTNEKCLRRYSWAQGKTRQDHQGPVTHFLLITGSRRKNSARSGNSDVGDDIFISSNPLSSSEISSWAFSVQRKEYIYRYRLIQT